MENLREKIRMSKVLYITANPKSAEQSFSIAMGEAFVSTYKEANPKDEIINVDLYNMPIPEIDEVVFSAWGKFAQGFSFEQLTSEEQGKIAAMGAILEQFMSADKYIFVTPLWNFTVPARMKSYLDSICVAGKTFKYTENGPVGLLKDKKAVHIQARGGIYSHGPAAAVEMGDKYVHAILDFVGITDKQSVIAEGMNAAPDKAQEIMVEAVLRAKEAARQF